MGWRSSRVKTGKLIGEIRCKNPRERWWCLRLAWCMKMEWPKHVQEISRRFSSLQFGCSVMSNSLQPHGLWHTRPLFLSPAPRVYSNSYPSSQWCHPIFSSSVVPFSSHLQSFPASGSFQMSQLFASGGKSIGISASTSVLPVNIHDWFPLGLTGWIFLQSKGLSRVFKSISSKSIHSSVLTFFIVQLSHPYMTTGKKTALTRWIFVGKVMSLRCYMLS